MIRPRATSEPRTLNTYSCESRSISSWIRTGGITIPSSPAIWRRIIDTRRTSVPPLRRSTSGTRPKPIPSSSGSSGSSLMTVSLETVGAVSCGAGSAAAAAASAASASGIPLRTAQPIDDEHPADQQERDLRQPGHECERGDHGAGDERRLALAQDLVCDVASEVLLGGRAGDDDAGRDRDQQRRDLCREAVADGQQREGLRGLPRTTSRAGACRRRSRRSG